MLYKIGTTGKYTQLGRVTILLLFSISFLYSHKCIGQQILYSERFDDSSSVEAWLKTKIAQAPHLNWNCDGTKSDTLARGCINVLQNIHNHRLNPTDRNGSGRTVYSSDLGYLMVGTPFHGGDWLVFASKSIDVSANGIYHAKVYARNLSDIGVATQRGNPEIRIAIKWLNGTKAGNIEYLTEYSELEEKSDTTQWDLIDNYFSSTEECKIELQVYAKSYPDVSKMQDITGYFFGLDDITLEEPCQNQMPANSWCVGKAFPLSVNVNQNLLQVKWYEDDVLLYTGGNSSYVHTFTSSGLKNIKTVRTYIQNNDTLYDSCTTKVFVEDSVVAGFTYSQASPYQIRFNNTSTGAIRFSWDFGDASPANTSEHPDHSYSTYSNTYIVKLTAYGICDTSYFIDTIDLCEVPVRLDIDTSRTGMQLTFTASGSIIGTGSTFYWSFGDGTNSTSGPEVVHMYNERGRYFVRLTVTLPGCGIDTTTLWLDFCDSLIGPQMSNPTICYGDSLVYTDNYLKPTLREWYIENLLVSREDTFVYYGTNAGTNKISLVIENGCQRDTFIDTVTVNEYTLGNFQAATAYPKVYLHPDNEAANSYSWAIERISGGYSDSSTEAFPIFSVPSVGQYTICLEITMGENCSSVLHCQEVCIGQNFEECCEGCTTTGLE